MRSPTRLTPLFVLAACAVAGHGHAAPAATATLPVLIRVTRVVLTDAVSGARLGEVQRPDSVVALVNLYNRLVVGLAAGAAPSPEIDAAFFRGSLPVAHLILASGAFETWLDGRVLRRSASPNDALAFVQLAGVPVKYSGVR